MTDIFAERGRFAVSLCRAVLFPEVGHQRVNELPMRNFFSNKHSPLPYASARLSDAEKFQFFLFGGRFPSAFAPDQLPCIHSLPANVTTRESRNKEIEKQCR